MRAACERAYADEPFVHLLPAGSGRAPPTCSGRTACTCRWPSTSASGRVVAVAAVDNLTKGTAGGAVQCANLALGPARDRGLPVVGLAP